jgi:hypothetical protein
MRVALRSECLVGLAYGQPSAHIEATYRTTLTVHNRTERQASSLLRSVMFRHTPKLSQFWIHHGISS